MPDDITIRQLTDYADLLACEKLQVAAWNMTGDRDVVPAHMLSPLIHNGGVVIGAVTDTGEVVGFVFGFVGRISDERAEWIGSPYIFCSEMMGVLPEYRSSAVGTRLKLAQREYAQSQGYKLMTWTYDPLLSLNANLNITKLGCIVRRYIRDAYGEMGGIYAGLSTDRFSVEWWLDSWRVKAHLDGDQRGELDAWLRAYPVTNPARQEDGILKPVDVMTLPLPEAKSCLVQVPADFQAVKQADFESAKAWRDQTRMLFEELFAWGFVIIGFAGRAGPDNLSSYYLLTREADIEAMARE